MLYTFFYNATLSQNPPKLKKKRKKLSSFLNERSTLISENNLADMKSNAFKLLRQPYIGESIKDLWNKVICFLKDQETDHA